MLLARWGIFFKKMENNKSRIHNPQPNVNRAAFERTITDASTREECFWDCCGHNAYSAECSTSRRKHFSRTDKEQIEIDVRNRERDVLIASELTATIRGVPTRAQVPNPANGAPRAAPPVSPAEPPFSVSFA